MGMSEELAQSFVEAEPDVNLDEGTIDGEAYQEPEEPSEMPETEESNQPTPEAELEAEPEVQDQSAEPEARTVPLDALHAERKRRQELEASMHNMEQRWQQMMQMMQNQQQPPQQEEQLNPQQQIEALGKRPDQFEDPDGYDEYNQKVQDIRDQAAQARIDALEAQINNQNEERQFNETLQTTVNQMKQVEEAYKEQHPEYGEALQFMRQKYIDQQRQSGRVGTDEQFLNEAFRYEMQLGMSMTMQGINPSEKLMELAKHNGFVAQASEPASTDEPNASMQKLENVERGQAVNKTSGPGGKAQTLEDMANMSDDDFEAAMNQFLGGVDFDLPVS